MCLVRKFGSTVFFPLHNGLHCAWWGWTTKMNHHDAVKLVLVYLLGVKALASFKQLIRKEGCQSEVAAVSSLCFHRRSLMWQWYDTRSCEKSLSFIFNTVIFFIFKRTVLKEGNTFFFKTTPHSCGSQNHAILTVIIVIHGKAI